MKNYGYSRSLSKDPVNKKISGVCSGLARYWGQPNWLIRLAALIALLMFPVPVAVAYLMAVLLLPNKYA